MRDRKLFIVSLVFMALFLITMLAIFSPLKTVFSPFVTALMICYFLRPAVKLLEKIRIKRAAAVMAVYLIIFAALIGVILYVAPKVCGAAAKMIEEVREYAEKMGLDIFTGGSIAAGAVRAYSFGMSAVQTGTMIFVGAAAAFYMLSDMQGIKKACMEFIPRELRAAVFLLSDDVKTAFDSFFRGQLLVAGILALLEGTYFYILKIPYAWALGLIGGLLDIIPYIGALAALAVSLLVTLVSVPEKLVWVLAGFLVIQQIENNILSPKIAGDSSSLHPASVILILYAGSFGGFWGILLSVPLACVFKKILQRLLQALI